MKFLFTLSVLLALIFSCKKASVSPTSIDAKSYYQSNGNFLVLQVGNVFEEAVEFNFPSLSLSNDSIIIQDSTVIDSMIINQYFYLANQNQVLFWSSNFINNNGMISFDLGTTPIPAQDFAQNTQAFPFVLSAFQDLNPGYQSDYAAVWAKVSKLKIVQEYRDSNPMAKIGMKRFVVPEYDEALAMNIPVEKHLIFLVK